MIEVKNLTKCYKNFKAVDNLSFTLQKGVATGFLGPNGAGKSTTMSMILGLVKKTSGEALVDGVRFDKLKNPLQKIGASLDASTVPKALTPYQYLSYIATVGGIPKKRITDTLETVGLAKVADKKCKEFSLGMRQRLGIAGALISDPESLILDEPFNGLDLDGIVWLRSLIKKLTTQGKAVLVSSHLMSETQEIADRIIIIAQGLLVSDTSMQELIAKSQGGYVSVKTPRKTELLQTILQSGGDAEDKGGLLHVRGLTAEKIGGIAFAGGYELHELTSHQPTLEQLYNELTTGKGDYHGK